MLKASAQRVQDALTQWQHPNPVIELEASAHTAFDAATALQCEVGQIVKSLIFQGSETKLPYLLLLSGINRVDLSKLQPLVRESVKRADPEWVKSVTGFAIGGIPPIAHAISIHTFMDERLFAYPMLWAAAGHSHAVFQCSPGDLQRMTNAVLADFHQC